MIKVDIVNELNGREFGGKFESQELADEWIAKQVGKQSWGLNERSLLKENLPFELEERVIDEFAQEHLSTNEAGEEVIELVQYVTVKADYVITEKNLNLSKTHRNKVKVENRKAEYPSIEELLHALMDHGIDSPEMQVLQGKRAEIKLKYPLEK